MTGGDTLPLPHAVCLSGAVSAPAAAEPETTAPKGLRTEILSITRSVWPENRKNINKTCIFNANFRLKTGCELKKNVV